MHKFTILFVVLCAVVLISAAPSKKHGHKKSHKVAHHGAAKSAKLIAKPIKSARRSHSSKSKYEVYPVGNAVHGFEDSDVVEEVFPENDEEAKLFDNEDAFEQEYPEIDVLVPRAIDVEDSVEEAEEEVYQVRAEHHQGGNYFNTHFGKTHGGAIGVANSYSTGKGGKAASTSNAYGAPAAHNTKHAILN